MKKEKILGVAEVKLSYTPALHLIKQPRITNSADAYVVFRDKWDPASIEFVEEFKVMLLSKANNVIGIVSISKGGVAGTIADPKVILVSAIQANAPNLMLCHNHPSGSLKPSQADIDLTKKIKEAARLLDLTLLDHLIISRMSYYSFADEGET